MKLFLMGIGSKKRIIFLAIILAVVANLLLGSSVSAKKLELNSNDVERIKFVLDLTKLISSIAVSDDKLKTVLNITTKGAESGADITYGLLVLTSLNEMDFIDSVVSQRYKKEADVYFNSVLDERLNLRNYYKGIGYDLPRVLAGRITSPMAALTLNTFGITEKTITIFTELNVLKKEKLYDGLWVYFDDRKSNETHKVAWEEAQTKMGFALVDGWSFSFKKPADERVSKLEPQFAVLYEKWGPYVEINKGVKKEFKEQVRMELQNTLALAAEEQALAEKEKENKLSFLGKMLKEAEKAMVRIQELAGLGGAQISQITIDGGEKGEKGVSQLEIGSPILDIGEVQEILDDISEKIDILAQKTEELTGKKGEKGETDAVDVKHPQNELIRNQQIENQQMPAEPVVFNYGTPTLAPTPAPEPAALKILITEVQISPSGERFVEIYNPNNEIINLSEWYIQRKTETNSSWNSFISSTHFEGKTIGALSHFFIASSTGADILLNLTLTEGNFLILKNPKRDIIDETEWSEIQTGKSFGRKWSTSTGNYLDTDNSQNDFEIQNPTPGARNQTPPATTTIEAIASESPSLAVVINEIAWMGTKASANDEWIELYNNTTSTIDLTGWKILKNGEEFIKLSASTIPANSFYLLERTASNTTDLAEDQIYTGFLRNDGEKLELKDNQNNLIDFLDFSAGWPAGSSTPNYISMERIDSKASGAEAGNWASNNLFIRNGLDAAGNNINGTPRAQNSFLLLLLQ